MIATIRGTVAEKNIDSAVIETAAGLGFTVQMPASMLDHLPAGGDVKLYTVMAVREDDVSLYGFPGREELDMFKLLLTVNKVGPKVALSILSALTALGYSGTEALKAVKSVEGAENMTVEEILKASLRFFV